MGYDCTLHVVDEAVFARVCTRVLGGRRARTEPVHLAGMVDETRRLLAEDPEDGARALAHLALAFAATETPHASSRGFALSLWDNHARVLGPPPPAKLVASVEPLLAPVFATYPKARHKIPVTFDGNYCTGELVPAKHVPALLAYVERTLADLAPGDRRPYAPLVAVLRAAAARKLAYWEATDFGFALTHAEWLEAPAPAAPGVTVARAAKIGLYATVIAVAPQRRLVYERDKLCEVSLATWPPTVRARPWQAPYATWTPWGTLLAHVAVTKLDPWVWSLVEEPRRAVGGAALLHGALVAAGDAVLAIGHGADGIQVVRADGRIEQLAVPRIDPNSRLGADRFAVAFGDGSALIGWYRQVFRWDGRGTKLVALPGTVQRPDGPGAVVEMPDGTLAGGFGRKLRAIARDGQQRVLAPLDNIMHVALGPDEALIVGEGDNPEGDFLKVVWTGSREIAHVDAAVFGLGDEPHLVHVYHDVDRARLVCLSRSATQAVAWRAVAWSTIAALPRTKLAAYTKARAAMQRKRRAKRR